MTVTVVTHIESAGIVNNVPRYNYTTERRHYYLPDEARESDEEITVPKYKAVSVTVPIYSGSKISGTRTETYYEATVTKRLNQPPKLSSMWNVPFRPSTIR